MLPFLKVKKDAGVLVSHRPSDSPEQDKDAGLMSAACDLKNALASGDDRSIAKALRAAFQIMESEPHEEEGSPKEGDE